MDDINYTVIGKRIRSRRNQLKMTQAQLVEKAHVGTKHISSIETAKSIPSLEAILRICDALEVPPNYVLYSLNDSRNPTLDALNRHISVCNQKEQGKILEYTEFIVSRRK